MQIDNKFAHWIEKVKWRSAVSFLVASIAFFSFLGSANQFFVSNTYYSVKNSLDSWNRAPSSVSTKDVEIALIKIEKVIDKAPNNALYYQLQGQLYEWLHFSTNLASDLETVTKANNGPDELHRAMLSYKKSLKLRPNWSGGWIGLASVKWKLGELDSQFYQYLDNAVSVGPQDAIVHRFIAEFGITMYMNRSVHYAKILKRLRHHLDLGIKNPLTRELILKLISKNNLNEPACRWLGPSSFAVSTGLLNCA
ncbi:VpsP family polysaccharide biosynthesis protein [Alteromonas sp. Cnat3-28]|uniref:VpsP family polysaccharide biosynthesis protein n=1 Tax=Alteromonas sp. Cnat3-28 TaxID=2917729 RepID=UPI001EF655CF|nr:VpsP family polysaccharide biosynthesis protein [Alteromonas sp. Cnat3-28]MCG7646033.1 VpsP family polysaccharide biosynthesis protein [Alteromonas sp. Cnat3-28]